MPLSNMQFEQGRAVDIGGCSVNYYRFYPGDYARDTGHLSLIEHGAFIVLLNTYYSTGNPLPVDMAILNRIARATTGDERKAVQSVVNQFFRKDGDFYRNRKADELIEADNEKIEAAKRSADARWKHERSDMRTHDETHIRSDDGNGCSPAPAPAPAPEKRERRTPSKFQKPTEEEAMKHGESMGMPASEGSKFHAYYEANGWRVGRNPMKDWKAALRTWRGKWEEWGVKKGGGNTNGAGPSINSIAQADSVITEAIKEIQRIKEAGDSWEWDGGRKLGMRPTARDRIAELNAKVAATRNLKTGLA